jgi:hypothetical protein
MVQQHYLRRKDKLNHSELRALGLISKAFGARDYGI